MTRIIGIKELKRAIKRNPSFVANRANIALVKSKQAYRSVIDNNAWKVNQSNGGGVPEDSGDLKRSHNWETAIKSPFRMVITFDEAPRGEERYGFYVHEGTRKMTARPWLDYARTKADDKVQRYYSTFLTEITKDLAK